jgi:hypothetical protein
MAVDLCCRLAYLALVMGATTRSSTAAHGTKRQKRRVHSFDVWSWSYGTAIQQRPIDVLTCVFCEQPPPLVHFQLHV